MPSATERVIRQSKFSGGAIGPSIEPRDDSGKRRSGVAVADNVLLSFGGPADKRPGFQIDRIWICAPRPSSAVGLESGAQGRA